MFRSRLCATAFAGVLLTSGLAAAVAAAQPASAAVASPAAATQYAADPGAGASGPLDNPGDYVGGAGDGQPDMINTGTVLNNEQLSGCALWLPAGGCSGVGLGQ